MSKGLSGELNTSARLTATLDESLYHYHHDIIVPFKNGSAQIDHLVVSPFGLFIIETKNLAGWIYGSSDKAKWTQVLFKTKHQFQNPLRQTFRQKKVIASYLRIREKDIHPIINFVGDCTFQTEMPPNVVMSAPDVYISTFKEEVFAYDELDRIQALILDLAHQHGLSQAEHIQSLKDRHASDTVCPKCGATLVKRTSQKGPYAGTDFLGCSAYPKCRFTNTTQAEGMKVNQRQGNKNALFIFVLLAAIAFFWLYLS